MTPTTRMVADIGGTNSRLALFDENSGSFRSVRHYANCDHPSLESVIEAWLKELNEAAPVTGCLAIAAPPATEHITMINIGWSFSCSALARQFDFRELACLNDFQANAYALPYLNPRDLEPIHPGDKSGSDALCTVGPGTGLGGAILRRIAGEAIAFAAEPGHMGLSPASELELAIFERLLPQYGNIYTELLVSGSGLTLLYRTICELNGLTPQRLDPADVSRHGLEGTDPQCVVALEVFCALLGSACGDFVLANGCYGGLYIAGGIAPRIVSFLQNSDFLVRLQNKGAMGAHLRTMPVNIITAENPGLIGAAHAPLQPD
jgi:glucokinase